MSTILTIDALQTAAIRLKTGIAEVKTLAAVESNGKGFLGDGRVTIRFEPHIFSARTGRKFDKSYPELSYPEWNPKIPRSTEHSWELFNAACSLNANAAVLSTSWGMFQVMGFNFASCGVNNLRSFVAAMERSEDRQLDLTVTYLLTTGLDDELREHRWADFARLYNGKQYKRNQYDTKLEAQFAYFSRVSPLTLT